MTRYISKGEWFDRGTEAKLIGEPFGTIPESGLFLGTKDGHSDEEVCSFDEFDKEEIS